MGAEQSVSGGEHNTTLRCDRNEWMDSLTCCRGDDPSERGRGRSRGDHEQPLDEEKEQEKTTTSEVRGFFGQTLEPGRAGGVDMQRVNNALAHFRRWQSARNNTRKDDKLELDTQLLCAALTDRDRSEIVKLMSAQDRDEFKKLMVDFVGAFRSMNYGTFTHVCDLVGEDGLGPGEKKQIEEFVEFDVHNLVNLIKHQARIHISTAGQNKARKSFDASGYNGTFTGIVPFSPRETPPTTPLASPRVTPSSDRPGLVRLSSAGTPSTPTRTGSSGQRGVSFEAGKAASFDLNLKRTSSADAKASPQPSPRGGRKSDAAPVRGMPPAQGTKPPQKSPRGSTPARGGKQPGGFARTTSTPESPAVGGMGNLTPLMKKRNMASTGGGPPAPNFERPSLL
mmetsp:Transcript_26774/g.52219  ORF Transcript_26774/g.52219 Transcript_26774/m.52219 type:complete len:395 (+) Transcript_26774:262-1446(+)